MEIKLIGLAAAFAGAMLAHSAQAAIVNIDATASSAVFYTFDPGTYHIEWIGKADGGAYDAWNPSCPTGDCTSGWRDVFTATTDTGLHPSLDTYSIPGGPFASALASLAAFKAAPSIIDTQLDWNGAMYVPTPGGTIAQPWIITVAAPTTVAFFAGDGTKGDNFGGVSLRFTAVPEPAAWTMMILGLGGVGVALRQRRRLVAIEVR
jgi:hypothetical protein